MQQEILNMMDTVPGNRPMAFSQLSFKPFLDYIRSRVENESGFKKEIFYSVLQKFAGFPELEEQMSPDLVKNYKEHLDLVYSILNPALQEEKNIFWALSVPMSPTVFYGSDAFYGLMDRNDEEDKVCGFNNEDDFVRQIQEQFYSFVLQRFYNIPFKGNSALRRSFTDSKTNLTRHFKLDVDTRFVDVQARSPLPKLDADFQQVQVLSGDILELLRSTLPVEIFTFSGFTILNISDVTTEHALEEIKDNIVVGQNDIGQNVFDSTTKSLKQLIGTNDIQFNILPLYRVNGKLVDDMDSYCQSIIFSIGKGNGVERNLCGPMIEKFVLNPKLIFFSDLDDLGPSQPQISRLFHIHGVKSYSLMPVYYHKKLVGALEMYSYEKAVLNEFVFNAIEPAVSLLAQMIWNSISAFDDRLEAIIKEKFTPLQPAVQWKFNEVAWHYLQMQTSKNIRQEPEEIDFKEVFPLYGAVDIRNSTSERNAALLKDLQVQLDTLLKVLHKLKNASGFGLLDEKIFITHRWVDRIISASGFEQEVIVNDFLENDIRPFLNQLIVSNAAYQAIAQEYFDAINEQEGIAYNNRRELERSMSTVISSVNNYFDMLGGEIQHSYPCFFEKFRTDGVEYDIYIGQSITPEKPYSDIYLQNLRLMQLRSMAAIASFSNSLLPQLSWQIQTTQLIFIHSHPIDIKFRRDEKRFDVEGAYNIRYHIIKKRIDKVRLKESKERLTQPNKIALVYFSQNEADEYISYIRYLQQENILNDDLEYLDLEELQGVSGLKALRVGVNLIV